jgi:hypothetical protein
MMEAVRTSETSVDNHFTRQYNPEDSSEYLTIDKMITDEGQNLNFNNLRSAYTRAVSIYISKPMV